MTGNEGEQDERRSAVWRESEAAFQSSHRASLRGPSAPFQSALKMTGSRPCSALVRIYDNSLINYLIISKFPPRGVVRVWLMA